jgi:hypothetical protein
MFRRFLRWPFSRQPRVIATEATKTALRTPAAAERKARGQKARDRYIEIAAALKAEAGVRQHTEHKKMNGQAWMDTGHILAPAGTTRRQLYILAHECGHIALHSTPRTGSKPRHVKEHEAESYAFRPGLRPPHQRPSAQGFCHGRERLRRRTAPRPGAAVSGEGTRRGKREVLVAVLLTRGKVGRDELAQPRTAGPAVACSPPCSTRAAIGAPTTPLAW